ncbi:MAG TPA: hypothetical protein VIY54_08110 [Steroidobacteraceae bacterium]
MQDVSITFRIDLAPHCSIGPGKIALLERIEAGGSLSQAARTMRMSYRRAWLLLEDLNTSFQQPVARLNVGGRGGGGAAVTAFGAQLVLAYRALETNFHSRARSAFKGIATAVTSQTRERAPVAKRRINRSAARARSHPQR